MSAATLFDSPHDERSIQQRFEEFHGLHPEVFDLFRRFAGELRARGIGHYSADAILHRIRWHYDVERVADASGFKINNSYSSRYARLLIQIDPSYGGFFELRCLKTE